MSKELTAVSLFSGCGGFDWGAQQAGVKVLWANDIDTSAAHAYQEAFPKVDFKDGDIVKVTKFPQADVLIGCYPCTGFSLGSRRRGPSAEERDLRSIKGNFLYREFLRALRQVQPRYLFVENVRGMLSADGGSFFKDQIKSFKELGYCISFAQLDSSHYGVAQLRERVFIVGVRRDVKDFRYKFLKPTHGLRVRDAECSEDSSGAKTKRKKRRKSTACLWTQLAKRPMASYSLAAMADCLPLQTMEDVIKDKLWPDDEVCEAPFHGHYLTRNRKKSWDDASFTIVAHMDHVPLHPDGEPMVNIGVDKWKLQGEANRRLSWRECAAIQGLPEVMVPSGELGEKYRVVGNAVPPAFGRALLQPVVDFESSL